MANNLARKGSGTSFIDPQPAIEISGHLIRSIVYDILGRSSTLIDIM